MNADKLTFKEVEPADIGIPTEAVVNFIQDLEADGFCMHGFLMVKDGHVFTEGYYAPFTKDTPHRMYSVGKSFTSVAIGLLQEEKKLSLSDCICDYFPDKLPKEGAHPYLLKTTIRDMLCMATPHKYTTYKQSEDQDWVKTFFTVEPTHYPGSCFIYDTSSTHVLSALVERLSGKSLLEYLKAKILNDLDCSNQMQILKDPMGVCQGGSGLICTMRDLAKFAYTCMNEGRYGNKQLIPADYIKEATSYQITTCLQPTTEEKQGYGYQFWRCRKNGFSLYGIGGQLAVCIPDKNFMLVTMADNLSNPNGVQAIYEALWHRIYPYLDQEAVKEERKVSNNLKEKIKNLSIQPVKGKIEAVGMLGFIDKTYYFEENSTGIKECLVVIDSKKKEGTFHYVNEGGKQSINFGLSYMAAQQFPQTEYKCISSGAFISENIFYLRTYVIDEVYASLDITMTFIDNTITILMKKTSEPFLQQYDGCITGRM